MAWAEGCAKGLLKGGGKAKADAIIEVTAAAAAAARRVSQYLPGGRRSPASQELRQQVAVMLVLAPSSPPLVNTISQPSIPPNPSGPSGTHLPAHRRGAGRLVAEGAQGVAGEEGGCGGSRGGVLWQ